MFSFNGKPKANEMGGRGWTERSEGSPGGFDVPHGRSPGVRCVPTLAFDHGLNGSKEDATNMKLSHTCLSADMLSQLAHDELTPSQLRDVEEHVSDCQRCRSLLQAEESDPHWQNDVCSVLALLYAVV